MSHDALHAHLGHFVLTFQAVEAALVELTVLVVDGDPEYIATLTAELEFNSKARALDVIYARFAQIHGLSEEAPHPTFHELVVRIQRLAARRNELLHSFYYYLTTVDGDLALTRTPTKLKPSEGLREQPQEDILLPQLGNEIIEMRKILVELEQFRLATINVMHPESG